MFRNAVIVILSLAAIALAVPGGMGMLRPLFAKWSMSDRCHCYIYFADGLVRMYMYRADEDVYYETVDDSRLVTFRRSIDDAICKRITHAKPGRISEYDLVSTSFQPPRRMAGPVIRLNGVRTHVKLPIALLIAYPLLAVVADRIRRRRVLPGHCTTCGYNLTGNTTGVCPECGDLAVCASCGYNLANNETAKCPECGAKLPK